MCLSHSALPFSQVRNRSSHNDNSHLIGCAHWMERESTLANALRDPEQSGEAAAGLISLCRVCFVSGNGGGGFRNFHIA